MPISTFVVISLSFFTVFGQHFPIKKCCPVDHVVKIGQSFSCVPVKDGDIKIVNYVQNFDSEFAKNLTIPRTDNKLIMVNNLVIEDKENWPTCGDDGVIFSIKTLDSLLNIERDVSCVDLSESNEITIFHCPSSLPTRNSQTQSDSITLYTLNKCCNFNMSYDMEARKCVEIEESQEINDEHDVVFKSYQLPNCGNEDDVLVEYSSNFHNIKLDKNLLWINQREIKNSFCVDNSTSNEMVVKVCESLRICEKIPCIRKCCKEREIFHMDSKKCENFDTDLSLPTFRNFTLGDDLSFVNDAETSPTSLSSIKPLEIGIKLKQSCKKYILEEGEYFIVSGIDGSVFLYNDFSEITEYRDNDNFCMDYATDDGGNFTYEVKVFACFLNEPFKLKIFSILLSISAMFLALTIIIYLLLPKLLLANLHGKIILCHTISLFVSYSLLSLVQFFGDSAEISTFVCKLLGYSLYFSFLAAFSWLNMMCFDIYWTFSSMKKSVGFGRSKDVKRFIYFSLYAWGVPCLMTLTTIYLDGESSFLDYEYRANIGDGSCFFKENNSKGHVILFLFPIGIQISINLILFVLTTLHITKVKSEINRMQSSDIDTTSNQKRKRFTADKAIFMMNLKLFTVMGVSWLLEIGATIFGDELGDWWTIADIWNLLQGVLVFLIFACKRKILRALMMKFAPEKLKKMDNKYKSSTTTSTTML